MRYLLTGFFAVILFACKNVSAPPDNIPKTFQEGNDGGSFDSYKRGGGGDAVNSMYNEILDDDAGLKSLEKDIRNIPGVFSDAAGPFNSFVYNNSNYYNAATNHMNSLRDSALREKIRTMIDNSRTQYQRSVTKHNALLNEINWKQATLNDLHTFLKLVKTLPMIENYQKKNLPPTQPLENVSAEYDKVIQRTKEASKQ